MASGWLGVTDHRASGLNVLLPYYKGCPNIAGPKQDRGRD